MIVKSIRWHIQLWHMVLLGLILSILLTWVYFQEHKSLRKNLEVQLAVRMNYILPKVFGRARRRPPEHHERRDQRLPRGRPINEAALKEEEEKGFDFLIFSSNRTVKYRTKGVTLWEDKSVDEFIDMVIGSGEERIFEDGSGGVTYLHHTPSGAHVLVRQDTGSLDEQLGELRFQLMIIGASLFTVGISGGWFMAGRSIKPLRRISETAIDIAAGNTDERINLGETESELGELALTLNQSFDRLTDSAKRQARFVADASHDLRTPITVIATSAQNAIEAARISGQGEGEQLDALKRSLDVSRHMGELVESLLDLARADSGQLVLHKEIIHLGELIRDCSEMLFPLFERKGIELQWNEDEIEVLADPVRVRQIIINLMSNALQYTNEGKVRVRLRQKDEMVVVDVEDTGEGMSDDLSEVVFERFYRGDQARKQDGNKGLGLAITKELVEAHGGSVKVKSSLGVGSCFTFYLPKGLD